MKGALDKGKADRRSAISAVLGLASEDILPTGIDPPRGSLKFRQNLKGTEYVLHVGGFSLRVKSESTIPVLAQLNPSDDLMPIEVNIEVN